VAAEPEDVDVGCLHDPPNGVIETFMDHDPNPDPLPGLAEQPDLVGHDVARVDSNAVAQVLERPVRWPGVGQDVVLLGQFVARVHDPVGEFAVVGQQQQPLGVPVEPANWEQALPGLNQVHDRPTLALVLHRRDVAAGLVEQDGAQALWAEDPAIDLDLIGRGVDPGAKLGDRRAIDEHPPAGDQFFGRPAR